MKYIGKDSERDYIKANRKANRDIFKDKYGDGFKSDDKPHKSLKNYNRKPKYKNNILNVENLD